MKEFIDMAGSESWQRKLRYVSSLSIRTLFRYVCTYDTPLSYITPTFD